jgi:DNA polymerase-3 subunit gamma/tau
MQMTIFNRPRKFEDLIGQPSIVKEMVKRRKDNNWPQAILLKGMTGTGKTTTAQLIAMTLNCTSLQEGNPCLVCPSCRSVIEERFDRDTHQLDGGNSSKGEVIDFGALSDFSPMYDRNAIFIVEEADQLSTAAKNSLLKILERPRANVYFILLSMINTGIPTALQSRCQTFVFKPFGAKDVMLGLKQVLTTNGLWGSPDIPKEFYLQGLSTIADSAAGSFRGALQILEKCLIGQYWTPELIRDNLGIVDIGTAYGALEKLLGLDNTFFTDFETLDASEFFGITYALLAEAGVYKFTRTCKNEYFEAQTRAISQNPNLYDLLKVYDDLQSYTYLKKTLILSKLSRYFAEKKSRRVVD